jgi:hypothetical protein
LDKNFLIFAKFFEISHFYRAEVLKKRLFCYFSVKCAGLKITKIDKKVGEFNVAFALINLAINQFFTVVKIFFLDRPSNKNLGYREREIATY